MKGFIYLIASFIFISFVLESSSQQQNKIQSTPSDSVKIHMQKSKKIYQKKVINSNRMNSLDSTQVDPALYTPLLRLKDSTAR